MHRLEEKEIAPQQFDSPLQLAEDILANFDRKYSYADLSTGAYPKGLDAKYLENYLEDEEFEEVFGMNRDQFAMLPGWKKEAMKKDKKLF